MLERGPFFNISFEWKKLNSMKHLLNAYHVPDIVLNALYVVTYLIHYEETVAQRGEFSSSHIANKW